MTYVGGGLVAPYQIPNGSWISNFKAFTVTAIGGGATAVNVTIGTAFQDASYSAATNVQAQGAQTLGFVGAGLAALRGGGTIGPLVITATVVGSTTAAGTVEVELHYCPPNP